MFEFVFKISLLVLWVSSVKWTWFSSSANVSSNWLMDIMNIWQFRIRTCVSECEISGCVGQECFPQCNSSSNGGPWYIQEPLYLQWKKWGCQGDCRYQCMVNRERERETLGQAPVKYHGKWPFKRVLGIQVSFVLQSLLDSGCFHIHGTCSLTYLVLC